MKNTAFDYSITAEDEIVDCLEVLDIAEDENGALFPYAGGDSEDSDFDDEDVCELDNEDNSDEEGDQDEDDDEDEYFDDEEYGRQYDEEDEQGDNWPPHEEDWQWYHGKDDDAYLGEGEYDHDFDSDFSDTGF